MHSSLSFQLGDEKALIVTTIRWGRLGLEGMTGPKSPSKFPLILVCHSQHYTTLEGSVISFHYLSDGLWTMDLICCSAAVRNDNQLHGLWQAIPSWCQYLLQRKVRNWLRNVGFLEEGMMGVMLILMLWAQHNFGITTPGTSHENLLKSQHF